MPVFNATVAALLPAEVHVTFPIFNTLKRTYVHGQQCGHVRFPVVQGDVLELVVPLSSVPGYGGMTGFPGRKIFHDTARAFVTTDGGSPTNTAALTALAQQIAQDYYDGLVDAVDLAFPSLQPWAPESYHDIVWEWDRDGVTTRVTSQAYNLAVEELNHFVPPGGSGSFDPSVLCALGGGCPLRMPVSTATLSSPTDTPPSELDLSTPNCALVYDVAGGTIKTIKPRADWLSGDNPGVWLYNSGGADIIIQNLQTRSTDGRPVATPGAFDLHIQAGGGALLMLAMNPADHTLDVWDVLSVEAGGPSGDQTVAIGFDADSCAPDCLTQAVVNGRIQSLAAGCGA